jgi:hypothetical protein
MTNDFITIASNDLDNVTGGWSVPAWVKEAAGKAAEGVFGGGGVNTAVNTQGNVNQGSGTQINKK